MRSRSGIGLLLSSRWICLSLRTASYLSSPCLSIRNLSQGGENSPPLIDRSKDSELLSEHIRSGMRLVPHPLMIITSEFRKIKDTDITASNKRGRFNSLPLPPEWPTSTAPRSTNHPGLLVSSFNTITLDPVPYVSFNVKLPSSTYDAIISSRAFTVTGISSTALADLYRKEGGKESKLDIDTNGVLFQMKCFWWRRKSRVIGDHIVMVGQVREYLINKSSVAPGKPLIYSEGTYRNAGEPLDESRPSSIP